MGFRSVGGQEIGQSADKSRVLQPFDDTRGVIIGATFVNLEVIGIIGHYGARFLNLSFEKSQGMAGVVTEGRRMIDFAFDVE
jgi:hypothetical protein